MIEISLVVSTYQRVSILRRSLPSILAQDLEPDRHEVVVVNDGSTDETGRFLEGCTDSAVLRIVAQPNRGLAAARNHGAREARGRIVLFLDDDAHTEAGLARAHLARHADGKDRVVQGAFPLLPDSRRSFLSAGVGRWSDALADRLSQPGYRPHFTDVSFANTSMPRSLWKSSGGFQESFREFGNEDYDLALRLMGTGVEFVFEPTAVARQDYRKRFRTWCAEWRQVGRADVRLLGLHPGIEDHLGFARIDRIHPLRRAALRGGMRGTAMAGPVVAPVYGLLSAADALGLTGSAWDDLKWIPADRQYGLGLREGWQSHPEVPVPAALAPFLR